MRVCLFEDHGVADLEPLSLTRPVFELLCGCTSLAHKQFRYFAASEQAALVRPGLAALAHESGSLAVNDLGGLSRGTVVLVNGRWLPPAPALETVDHPCVGVVDDEIAYVLLPAEERRHVSTRSLPEGQARWKAVLPHRPAGGRMLRHLWQLVDHNAEQIILDAWLSSPQRTRRGDLPLALVGPADRLVIDPTAKIDPLVAADTRNGPVLIDREAVVTSFTRLEGPCYIGPRTQIQGARIRAGTTLGPECRIGGEVEASIVQGFSNKVHDGFLGHAYLGEWINLGAGTQNSDLRNDYGHVQVTVNGQVVNTERTKIGCYLGDHTKAGLASLLNTGTNVGIFCNLLPTGGLLPKYAPSFTRVWNGHLMDNLDLPALFQTAAAVMLRRGRTLSESQRTLYALVMEQTASLRKQTVRDAETRRLRRSA